MINTDSSYIAQKQLDDGNTLKIRRWISRIVRPGHVMYQLHLTEGKYYTANLSKNYEDFTETQIREWYGNINSEADFERLIDELSQSRKK